VVRYSLELVHQIQLVFLSARNAIVKDLLCLLQLVVDTWVVVVRLGRTWEEALDACHIDRRAAGSSCRRRVDFGMMGRILLVALYLGATGNC
jgi:hypothetical protein